MVSLVFSLHLTLRTCFSTSWIKGWVPGRHSNNLTWRLERLVELYPRRESPITYRENLPVASVL